MAEVGWLIAVFGALCVLLSWLSRVLVKDPPPRPDRMVGGGFGAEGWEEASRQHKRLLLVGAVAVVVGLVLALLS